MLNTKLLRGISRLLIVTTTALALQPLTAAAQLPSAAPVKQVPATPGERYGQLLDEVKVLTAGHRSGATGAPAVDKTMAALRTKAEALAGVTAAAVDEFAATEAELQAKKLPAEILARHRAAVAEFQAREAELQTKLAAALNTDAAGRGAALRALADFMAKHQKGRSHTPTDPKKLPWGTPTPVKRAPYTNPAEFQLSKLFGEPVKLAAAGSLSGLGLPGTTLPATPTADDLAETEDAQLTPTVKAKAQELGNNPVQIHNWVRNNIEFIPSYGSIQGADLTLSNKRGNAFDTASLEIALLRAANIPARYVYGTIDVPVDQAMNWVGGVTKAEAAQSLLGQGGIPNVALTAGGKIQAIRMEHVWVEAFVDYVPSRGAKQVQGDTWVPMDGSFKQYAYSQGMDLKSAVPVDAQSLLTQAQQGATVNEAEGWVQNLNAANLQTALASYRTQVKTYIDAQKPNATVGDVLGTKAIQAFSSSVLMATLPYKTVATGSKFAGLPDNLRWKYRTLLYPDGWSYALEGGELASINRNTAALAGKKLTISFIPASQADLDLINSYLPKPHADGSPIQPSELPSSLPGYLLLLKAEIRVDGQVVAQSADSVTMGQQLAQATAMFNPGSQQWEEGEPNQPIAGEYQAIGLDLQGVGSTQLVALKARLEATKARLEQFQLAPGDSTPIQGLTKEDLAGDLLYAGILGYFASVDGSDQLAARSSGNIVAYRLPSYGAFMASAQPRYWFGIVRSVSFPGATMDVDRVFYHAEAKDNDPQKKLAWMRQVGSAGSAFEHAVPERMLADPTKPLTDPSQPQGVSAVKAIAIAAAQGQKIYTLSAKNQAYHVSIISQLSIDADVKAEIQNALAVGREVTTHQADISVSGWTGSGYIILDPDTGAGAYKISGGANGGNIENAAFGLLGLTSLILFANKLALLGIIAAISPYLLLLAGGLALIMALLAGSLDRGGAMEQQIEAFVSLAIMGSIALIAGFAVVAFLAYTIMLIMIARLAFMATI